jgi:NADPH:quinone reductase-like Zn-dependent oxidoreductase
MPQPERGEIRIHVAAAGVNPVDNAILQGCMKDFMEHRFPLVPGIDASGSLTRSELGSRAGRSGIRLLVPPESRTSARTAGQLRDPELETLRLDQASKTLSRLADSTSEASW